MAMRVFVVALAIDNVENYCGINEQTDCYAIFLTNPKVFFGCRAQGILSLCCVFVCDGNFTNSI